MKQISISDQLVHLPDEYQIFKDILPKMLCNNVKTRIKLDELINIFADNNKSNIVMDSNI